MSADASEILFALFRSVCENKNAMKINCHSRFDFLPGSIAFGLAVEAEKYPVERWNTSTLGHRQANLIKFRPEYNSRVSLHSSEDSFAPTWFHTTLRMLSIASRLFACFWFTAPLQSRQWHNWKTLFIFNFFAERKNKEILGRAK